MWRVISTVTSKLEDFSHVHCKRGSVSEIVQDTTRCYDIRKWLYGHSNRAISDDLESLSRSCTLLKCDFFVKCAAFGKISTDITCSSSWVSCWLLWSKWWIYTPCLKKCATVFLPLFCSLAFLDPRVGHTVDVLSPFISILCHSDWLFHRESCPRLDVVYPGRAWSSSPACNWPCSSTQLIMS